MLVPGLIAALTLGSAPAGGLEVANAVELRWSAPPGCPTEEDVHGWIGRLVSSPGPTERRARVTIEAVAGGLVGVIELDGERARRLEAEDCAVLGRAIAVVIAVSLDPIAVVEATKAPVGPAPVMPEPVVPTPVVPEPARRPLTHGRTPRLHAARATVPVDEPAREPRPSRPRSSDASDTSDRSGATGARAPLELGLRLGGGLGGFLLPSAGVGLSLAGFLGPPRLHVRVVAQYWAPQRKAFDPRRDASGEIQLASGGVRVCPQLVRPRVRVPLCAGVDAGAMLGQGTGSDLSASRTAQQPWVGAVLEPGVTLAITSHLSLWLALEGVISLYLPRFAIDNAPEGWTAGAGALRGLLGIQLHGRRPASGRTERASKIP